MNYLEAIEHLSAVTKVVRNSDTVIIETSIEELHSFLYYLKEHLGFIYLIDVTFESENLNYIVKNLEVQEVVCVCCPVNKNEKIPSSGNIWNNAHVCEATLKELNSVSFEFDIKSKFLFNEDTDTIAEISLTPVTAIRHPLLKNDLQWDFKLQDNFIVSTSYEGGYLFRNLENKFKKMNASEILMNIGKINTLRSFSLESVWCDNIEKSLDLTITDRACAVRMIFLELERIQDHLNFFSIIACETNFIQMHELFCKLRQSVSHIVSFYTGNKGHTPINCIGGIRYDVPRGWIAYLNSTVEEVTKAFKDFFLTIETSSFWKQRLSSGIISSKEAINFGLSGPNLRASGINFDLRKSVPYYFYSDIDFQIPVGQKGSTLDRCLIRKEEVIQSLSIISQVVDNIPTGEITVGDLNYFRGNFKNLEIDKDKYLQTVLKSTPILSEAMVNMMEGPNGYLGIYLLGNNDEKIENLKVLSSDKFALEAYVQNIAGNDFEDVMLIYSSLNIHICEVEK